MPDEQELSGPDLGRDGDGIAAADLAEGDLLLGHVDGAQVLLVRRGDRALALEATCSHYGASLADGVFDGACLRCPWHHAAFDVQTGEVVRPPAFNDLATYDVEEREGRLFVTGAAQRPPSRRATRPDVSASAPDSVVIIGAGAAGNTTAETLRREGYSGSITLVGAEDSVPYDRPNLSKDYLAGHADEDWIPLRSPEFYAEQDIDLVLGTRADAIDPVARSVALADGRRLPFGALLLATGAEPIRLDVRGADLPHVHTLRSLADSRVIIEASKEAPAAVVVGASFIGLEVASSLRARELEVHVVDPSERPMERVLGRELGDFVRALHQEHGVHFHMGRHLASIERGAALLDDGTRLDASLVVVGIGVRPAIDLAQAAGIAVENGVLVDEHLATSVPGIWAAGDIARWPDPRSGDRIRIEHWVVAQRQGQTAARNMLGRSERFDAVPFFWSQHYDVAINYVGHAERWERIEVRGSLDDREWTAAYRARGKTLAIASMGRDIDSLLAELAMERGDEAALQALVPSERTP